MEKRLTNKIEQHQLLFKNSIKEWIQSNNCEIYNSNHDNITSKFLQYIYDYTNIQITKEDFQKRKRCKNVISIYERCTAKRANNEQCSRRKMEGEQFCGTHIKGTPNGIIDHNDDNENKSKTYTIETKLINSNGIYYHIDSNNNVYHTDDVISNKKNPRRIAKWETEKDENGNEKKDEKGESIYIINME